MSKDQLVEFIINHLPEIAGFIGLAFINLVVRSSSRRLQKSRQMKGNRK